MLENNPDKCVGNIWTVFVAPIGIKSFTIQAESEEAAVEIIRKKIKNKELKFNFKLDVYTP